MGSVSVPQPPPSIQPCIPVPAPARLPHSKYQSRNQLRGRQIVPFGTVVATQPPAASHQSILGVLLEEKYNKITFAKQLGWQRGEGGCRVPVLLDGSPGASEDKAHGSIPSAREGCGTPPTPQPCRGCPERLLCKRSPSQENPASPALQSPSMQPCVRGPFPRWGRIWPWKKGPSAPSSSCGFYGKANKRYCCPSKFGLLYIPRVILCCICAPAHPAPPSAG